MVVAEGGNLLVPGTLLFVDGSQDSTFSGSGNIWNLTEDTDVNIGRRGTHDDRYFQGLIDDVRIYDRALSPAEVAGLAGKTIPYDVSF